MASERIQRQIARLLDDCESAANAGVWSAVAQNARAVLAVDAGNGDAQAFLTMAEATLASADPVSPQQLVADARANAIARATDAHRARGRLSADRDDLGSKRAAADAARTRAKPVSDADYRPLSEILAARIAAERDLAKVAAERVAAKRAAEQAANDKRAAVKRAAERAAAAKLAARTPEERDQDRQANAAFAARIAQIQAERERRGVPSDWKDAGW